MKSQSKKTTISITDQEFLIHQAGQYDLIPLVLKMDSVNEDPLSIYRKLREGQTHSFLLESGVHGDTSGRYSFIGTDPEKIFRITREGCHIYDSTGTRTAFYPSPEGNRKAIQEYLDHNYPETEDLPPFKGGLAGYFGYSMVDEWENLFHGTGRKLRSSDNDMALLMGFDTVIALDHETDSLFLIHNVRIPKYPGKDQIQTIYREGVQVLENLSAIIDEQVEDKPSEKTCFLGEIHNHTSEQDFLEMVRIGREKIIAGDICQVVLSQRFSAETDLPSLDIYQSLKESNPSPYLFYLDLPELELIGSSPEVLVKVEDGHIITRPLAGTRRRGSSRVEDQALADELVADEKERAEHLMLVDLARNDLGRVCKTGTISVTELMGVEYYSQVMHMVSQVEGQKRDDMSALDVLKSAFPAGTVSGAPKIRAMEIIEELESYPRGPYAGAVGYLGFDNNLDTCIVIRTIIREENTVSVQAGAGIVFDSIPEKEYEETQNKARALFRALGKALERRNSR